MMKIITKNDTNDGNIVDNSDYDKTNGDGD